MYHPERYHGEKQTHDFFEGWYFKSYNEKRDCIAVVPGIFRGKKDAPENSHAFIFVNVNGKEQHYYRFPVDSFLAEKDEFKVTIAGKNVFSENGFTVDLEPKKGDDAKLKLKGSLAFDGNFQWPVTWLNPGVMGMVAYFPFVECYHGIMSMDHSISGQLELDGEANEFTGGRGYLEKDWGKHFPSSWIWLQTNCFPDLKLKEGEQNPSLFFSVAHVPYMGTSFPGFICGFVDTTGHLHKFTSYLLSGFKQLQVDEEKKEVSIHVYNRQHELIIHTNYHHVPMVTLYGPDNGKMGLSVPEGVQAKITIELRKKNNSDALFKATGICGGIEVQGDVQGLCKSF